jgi:hypothetical protein
VVVFLLEKVVSFLLRKAGAFLLGKIRSGLLSKFSALSASPVSGLSPLLKNYPFSAEAPQTIHRAASIDRLRRLKVFGGIFP